MTLVAHEKRRYEATSSRKPMTSTISLYALLSELGFYGIEGLCPKISRLSCRLPAATAAPLVRTRALMARIDLTDMVFSFLVFL
jgi:hypothetical protein